jgi:transposase-like protein
LGHASFGSLQYAGARADGDPDGPGETPGTTDAAAQEATIVSVPVATLRPGETPRLDGEDKAHVARLAEAESSLPPILVDRHSMRVIDGMHRLLAASLRGQEAIDVEFFDGSPADAFLRGVEANVTHGLPLSLADRRAAAARIVASHPQMSDRAIGQVTGLAARTVAGVRRRATGSVPQLNARIGKDGRIRPLNSVEGRRRAAALLMERPEASLREVARAAGISPTTARDVRRRLERGEEPASGRAAERGNGAAAAAKPRSRGKGAQPEPMASAALEKLLRDPSLRHNEQGRRFLRMLLANAVGPQEWSRVIEALPPHCVSMVVQVSRQYAQMWLRLAQEVDERARDAQAVR